MPKPPPPQPGFKNLVNAFSGPSRVKRQRTQEPSPVKVEPCTPEASPVKPKPEVEVLVEVIDPPDKKTEVSSDDTELKKSFCTIYSAIHMCLPFANKGTHSPPYFTF